MLNQTAERRVEAVKVRAQRAKYSKKEIINRVKIGLIKLKTV
jgi:hypothetical protein